MIRRRVLAWVAWRDLRRVLAGRRLGLAGLALAVLLPLGALPLQPPAAQEPGVPVVQGEIPAALAGQLRTSRTAQVHLAGDDPIVVSATALPRAVREALESIESEPSVTVLRWRPALLLPSRNLLVALLAISLLTGPLAESLPGEREEGTMETLLAAAISRGELVGGKWLAWTASASGVALLGCITGMLTGAQQPGLWLLGVPLSVSVAVALGLWLVRRAGDAMSGATAPMRVIPVVAVALLGGAWWLSVRSTLLAAAVPLGGGLMLAGGMLQTPGEAVVALMSTAAATVGLLSVTARALTQPRSSAVGSGGLVAAGAVLWWLPVMGPAVWQWAGRGEMVDGAAGLRAGGALLLLAALVVVAGDPQRARRVRFSKRGALLAAGVGLLLVALESLPGTMAAPAGLTALLVALGQEVWFRGVLLRQLGVRRAWLSWVLIVGLAAPLHAAVSGALLSWLSSRYGLFAALAAAMIWRLLG